ncbi:MAG: UvrD-helicase domain-containing protein [Pseudomonadota bacterium]|nr:UvrD-helicase domain-containing protein [Pseudomonadota bacterium]
MSAPADQQARDRALRLDRHVITIAPAGSGKTGLLVRRALRALASVDQPESVVCITFTNKAAAEIRLRVMEALELAEGPAPDADYLQGLYTDAKAVLEQDRAKAWALRRHPDRLQAMTIDAFNQTLAARLPMLSGLGGPMAIAQDPQALYMEAVLAVFEEGTHDSTDPADQAAIGRVLAWADNRLDQLLPALTGLLAQRDQWIEHLGSLLDDSGTTDARILQTLVRHHLRRTLEALPSAAVLALTDAAQHARAHWPDPSLHADLALEDWPGDDPAQLPAWRFVAHLLLTSQGEWRRTVNKAVGFPTSDRAAKQAFVDCLEVLATCAESDTLCRLLDRVRSLPEPALPEDSRALRAALGRVLRLAYAQLRLQFANRGEADFTEVALAAVTAASGEGGSEAIARTDAQMQHLLVDEMQDTSESQIRLLRELTANWQPGDGRSLFLVGDPQQSIYAFRKADVRLFVELIETRQLGALSLHVEQLSANFRSAPALIDWFNNTLGPLFPPRSDRDIGTVTYAPCTAGRATGTATGVQIVPVPSADRQAEVDAAVQTIVRLAQQTPQSEHIAILAATRPQLTPVLDALRGTLAEPVQAVDIDPLAERPDVRDVVQLIRALRHPEERLAWTALLRAPFVGLYWADLVVLSRGRVGMSWPERLRDPLPQGLSDDARQRIARLRAALDLANARRAELADAADALWTALSGPACVSADDFEAIRRLFRLLRQCSRGGELGDWPSFERQLSQLYRGAGRGRIEALTIHKSKGLQYAHVVLVGCGRAPRGLDRPLLHLRSVGDGVLLVPRPEDEALPGCAQYDFLHDLASDASEAEAMRLLYVAVTRAQESLHLVAGVGADARGHFKPRARSIAARLWPALAPAFAPLQPDPNTPATDTEGAATAATLPTLPRLPAHWADTLAAPAWSPVERRTLKPSEQVLEPDAASGVGDLQATLIGNMFHEALERVIAEGLDRWADAGRSRQTPMRAGFRRMGMPEAQVDVAVARVTSLLERTLTADCAPWMLGGHPWHASEYAVSGWLDGQWVSAVIDRCLETAQGELWVIDYKTTRHPITDPVAREHYRDKAVEQYAAQLRQYGRLLARLRGHDAVRLGLYLAELGELIDLSDPPCTDL